MLTLAPGEKYENKCCYFAILQKSYIFLKKIGKL
jgi:hypothetical protein